VAQQVAQEVGPVWNARWGENLCAQRVARNPRAVCPIPYIASAIGNSFDAQRRPPGGLTLPVFHSASLCALTNRSFAADA